MLAYGSCCVKGVMYPVMEDCLHSNDQIPIYSVIIPVYNSASTLSELYHRIVSVMESIGERFELVFVEDCGSDPSWQVLRDMALKDNRVTALQLLRNSGQGNATLAGMRLARGQYIVTIDDDLQHPPEELPKMINALLEDEQIDVVIGVPKEKRQHFIRRLGSSFINQINSVFLDKDPLLRLTGFRVMRSIVAQSIIQMRVPYPALGPMILSVTRRVRNVTVRHDFRKEGQSGYTFRRIVKQTLSNLIGYSMLPLRLLALLGVVGIIVSILLGGYYLYRYFFIGVGVPGWTTILILLLTFSGFNFFAFAVIGEYVLRITQISTQTSQCVVRETVRKNSVFPK